MVEINNLTRFKFDKKILEDIVQGVLKAENKEKTDLSIVIVGSKDIQKFNKKYRNIDRPTDVLSFTFKEAGEIMLCPQIVKDNAKKYGELFQKEFYRVLIHGILHIVGYDHGNWPQENEIMLKKQENYLAKILNHLTT
jgi:probable rRNA maturation factor